MFTLSGTWTIIDLVAFMDIIIVPLMIDLENAIHILWVVLDDLQTNEGMSCNKVVVMIFNICTIVTFLRTTYANILVVVDTMCLMSI